MAKIPYVGLNSPFGNRGPDRNTPMNADTRGIGSGLAEATGAIAKIGGAVVDMMEQQRQQDAAIARANASNSALDDQMRLDALTDEHAEKLRTGELTWADADKAYAEAVDTREIPEIAGIGEVDKINYQRVLDRNAFMAKQKWQTTVTGYKREYGASQVFGATEKLLIGANNPASDPDALVQQGAAFRDIWVQTGNKLDTFDKEHARFKADVYDKNYAARLNAVIDNPEGLSTLRQELANEGYWGQRLGPEKANTAMAAIDRRIDSFKADQERNIKKNEKLAETLIGEVSEQVELGQNPGEERLLQAREYAKNYPELAMRLTEAEQTGSVVQQMLAMPATEQRAWVAKERAKLDAGGGTQSQYTRLDRIDATLKRRADARKADPFGDPVLSPSAEPLQFNNPAAMGAELNARMAASDAARENNPDFGTALMRPEEAVRFTEVIKKTSPEQMPALLGMVYQSSGEKAYRRVMEQVGITDGVIAQAGIRFVTDLKAGRPPTVAVGIAKGRTLMTAKDSTLAMPEPKAIAAEFDAEMGGKGLYANRPNDYRNDLESVKAYYANATAEAGDTSGEMSPQRWRDSLKAVLGEPVDIEGVQVLPPPGMEPDRFEASATRQIQQLTKQYNLNTGFLAPDISLRNIDGKPGYYFLINEDGALIKDDKGNTIGVNLNE